MFCSSYIANFGLQSLRLFHLPVVQQIHFISKLPPTDLSKTRLPKNTVITFFPGAPVAWPSLISIHSLVEARVAAHNQQNMSEAYTTKVYHHEVQGIVIYQSCPWG
jgi:hypothetical protein